MTAGTSDRSVYIVDDDEASRDSLLILLEMNGIATRCFASADAFLQSDTWDMACLLLDLHMPGMSGLELLKVLRAAGITQPIICISGGSDAQLDADVRKAGATALLYKPFGEETLLPAIRNAIAGKP